MIISITLKNFNAPLVCRNKLAFLRGLDGQSSIMLYCPQEGTALFQRIRVDTSQHISYKKAFKKFLKENTSVKLISPYVNMQTKSTFYCKVCLTPFERRCNDLKTRVTTRDTNGCPKCGIKRNAEIVRESVIKEMMIKLENDNIKSDRVLKSYSDSADFTFPCGCTHHLSHANMRDYHNSKCPSCNKNNSLFSRPHTVYYIEIYGRYKIGVACEGRILGARVNSSKNMRYTIPEDYENIRIVQQWDNLERTEAFEMERNIINEFEWAKYDGDKLFADGTGNTEVFTHDVLGLDND